MTPRRFQILLMCLILLLGFSGGTAEGCGSSENGGTNSVCSALSAMRRQATDGRGGALRAIKWGVGWRRGLSIQIGAFVPYCEEVRPKPHIERVVRRQRNKKLILTMLVRFPKLKAEKMYR